MHKKELETIKENFMDIYKEMTTRAIKKFKFHQYLIAKELKMYVDGSKAENSSDEEYDANDSGSDDGKSVNSENLDEKFERSIRLLSSNLMVPGKNYVDKREGSGKPFQNYEGLSATGISSMQKLAKKRDEFDFQFQKTLRNFGQNMTFLEDQQ